MAFSQEEILPQRWSFFSYYEKFGTNGKYSTTLSMGTPWMLQEIRLRCSTAFASAENFVAQLIATYGSEFNVVVFNWAMSGSTDVIMRWSNPMMFLSNDVLGFVLSMVSGTNVIGLNVQGWAVRG